jgi:hypothetical protein
LNWIVAPALGLKLNVVLITPFASSMFTVVRSELFRKTGAGSTQRAVGDARTATAEVRSQ